MRISAAVTVSTEQTRNSDRSAVAPVRAENTTTPKAKEAASTTPMTEESSSARRDPRSPWKLRLRETTATPTAKKVAMSRARAASGSIRGRRVRTVSSTTDTAAAARAPRSSDCPAPKAMATPGNTVCWKASVVKGRRRSRTWVPTTPPSPASKRNSRRARCMNGTPKGSTRRRPTGPGVSGR